MFQEVMWYDPQYPPSGMVPGSLLLPPLPGTSFLPCPGPSFLPCFHEESCYGGRRCPGRLLYHRDGETGLKTSQKRKTVISALL